MTLPTVFTEPFTDELFTRLKDEAAMRFRMHQLREDRGVWKKQRTELRERLWKSLGTRPDHDLPLEYCEHGKTLLEGYSVRNITYQSRPGFRVTGNLYVPDGKGPFPAVINLHGHFSQGRLAERVQSRGHSLARNGYVCLSVDAFGSGERCTAHGAFEYHGSNLGASLMNVGETLMGMQVVDNMRGVDLLRSLDFVERDRIGATGASGGGNQTMWLAAMDERIAAAMPVVSVGSFQSYVMGSNCVCELLPDGLTFTEESGVLALMAPRALKLCNCLQDTNPTFFPAEMLRSVREARKIFRCLDADANLAYQIFNLTHGYWPEVREAMLGWFDLHLKGIGHGAPRVEIPFETLSEQKVMVFEKGRLPAEVRSIPEFCIRRGSELREAYLGRASFDAAAEKEKLSAVLRLGAPRTLADVLEYGGEDGWEKVALKTGCGRLIPLLVRPPTGTRRDYTLLCHPEGKQALAGSGLLDSVDPDSGVILADLWCSGETATPDAVVATFHTLSRGALWLGKTVLGEWVRDLALVTEYARKRLRAGSIVLGGVREGGLAALFTAAFAEGVSAVTLEHAPVRYGFHGDGKPEFFSMVIHLPGFLRWGDVSLAAALTGVPVRFRSPLWMDGSAPTAEEVEALKREFAEVRAKCALPGGCEFTAGVPRNR